MNRHLDPQWEVSVDDLKSRMDAGENILLIDVRQPEEFEVCRITGAHHIPLPRLQEHIEHVRTLAEGREIITYCHHGHRSVQAAAILREAGLGRVLSMAGGIDAWSARIDASVARY